MGMDNPFRGNSANKQISANIFMQQLFLYPESLNGNQADRGKTSWCRPSNSHVKVWDVACPCHLVFSSCHHILLFPCFCSHAYWILHELIQFTTSDKTTRRELGSVQPEFGLASRRYWWSPQLVCSQCTALTWRKQGCKPESEPLHQLSCCCTTSSIVGTFPHPVRLQSLAWGQGWDVSAMGWSLLSPAEGWCVTALSVTLLQCPSSWSCELLCIAMEAVAWSSVTEFQSSPASLQILLLYLSILKAVDPNGRLEC